MERMILGGIVGGALGTILAVSIITGFGIHNDGIAGLIAMVCGLISVSIGMNVGEYYDV